MVRLKARTKLALSVPFRGTHPSVHRQDDKKKRVTVEIEIVLFRKNIREKKKKHIRKYWSKPFMMKMKEPMGPVVK